MTQESKDDNQSSAENYFLIAIMSLILFAVIGVVIYKILMNIVGFNDDDAGLTSIAICIFIAYKLLENKKDKSFSNKETTKENLKSTNIRSNISNSEHPKNDTSKNSSKVISEDERNQKDLDRYVNANHSKEDIGLFYERYIGYIFESKGWHVIYHGAKKGKEDEGIDLICIRNDRVRLVQCKYWSQNKTLFENSIFQLYGTWQFRVKRNDFAPKRLDAYLITSTVLSEFAKNSAETLDINIKQNFKLNKNYPKIKCTTTKEGEKIYHLPTDQQYDNIGINKDSRRFYVHTVADAVAQGHRRAYRHRFTN